MACSLPQFILLKASKNDKYLRYRKEDDSKHASLQFSGVENEESFEIQYVKFEVQKSESMEGFVHIRSCYNNKYWVRKCGVDEGKKSWIVAEGNEQEEDPLKPSCTLFKPVLVDEDDNNELVEHDKPQKIRLIHIDQEGQQGCIAPPESGLLTLQQPGHKKAEEDVEEDVFTAYNASSVVVLPRFVAFTNHEGKYGALTTLKGVKYVDFKTNDIGLLGVMTEIHQFNFMQPPYMQCTPWGIGTWCLPAGSNVVRLLNFSEGPLMELIQ